LPRRVVQSDCRWPGVCGDDMAETLTNERYVLRSIETGGGSGIAVKQLGCGEVGIQLCEITEKWVFQLQSESERLSRDRHQGRAGIIGLEKDIQFAAKWLCQELSIR